MLARNSDSLPKRGAGDTRGHAEPRPRNHCDSTKELALGSRRPWRIECQGSSPGTACRAPTNPRLRRPRGRFHSCRRRGIQIGVDETGSTGAAKTAASRLAARVLRTRHPRRRRFSQCGLVHSRESLAMGFRSGIQSLVTAVPHNLADNGAPQPSISAGRNPRFRMAIPKGSPLWACESRAGLPTGPRPTGPDRLPPAIR